MSAPRGTGLWRRASATPGRRLFVRIVGVGLGAFLIGYALTAVLFFSGRRKEVATVPDLRGRTEAAARRLLGRDGLELRRGTTLNHPTIPAGAVVAQSPLPGQEVAPGAQVQVNLSGGPDRVRVPDVRPLRAEQAQQVLEHSGLQVRIERRADERAAGRVVATRPAAGATVAVPSQVVLVVSDGPPRVAVPALVGRQEPEAGAALAAVGLRLGAVDYDPLSLEPFGTVVAQRPAAGDSVRAGGTVAIVVAGAPPLGEPVVPAAEPPAPPELQGVVH